MNQLLAKVQRSITPLKNSSRPNFIEDEIKPDDLIGEHEDLRNTYSQYLAGQKSHKASSNKLQPGFGSNSNSISSHTQHLFKSYGATDRASSSQNNPKVGEQKLKKDLIKAKQSNRETLNRTVLNGSTEFTQISMGRSPDRNKSLYSHGASGSFLNNSTKHPYQATLLHQQNQKENGRNTSLDQSAFQMDVHKQSYGSQKKAVIKTQNSVHNRTKSISEKQAAA